MIFLSFTYSQIDVTTNTHCTSRVTGALSEKWLSAFLQHPFFRWYPAVRVISWMMIASLETVSIQSLYSLLVLASLLSRELNIVHCTIPMLLCLDHLFYLWPFFIFCKICIHHGVSTECLVASIGSCY